MLSYQVDKSKDQRHEKQIRPSEAHPVRIKICLWETKYRDYQNTKYKIQNTNTITNTITNTNTNTNTYTNTGIIPPFQIQKNLSGKWTRTPKWLPW